MTNTDEQLRDHVKSIADTLSGIDTTWIDDWKESHPEDVEAGQEEPTAIDYLEDALEIQYIISQDKEYRGARILVTFGGPNIWIDTLHNTVDGYWWGNEAHHSFTDDIGLDDTLEELYQS